MTETMVNIYCLINPIDKSVFYVGCTCNKWNRLAQHLRESKKLDTNKDKTIQKIESFGLNVEILILETCFVMDASFWENFYIDLFKSFGFDLCQSNASCYSKTFSDKSSFVITEHANVRVRSETINSLTAISEKVMLSKDFLLKIAIQEFIEKYDKYGKYTAHLKLTGHDPSLIEN